MGELSNEKKRALALARARQRQSAQGQGGGVTGALGRINKPIFDALSIITDPIKAGTGFDVQKAFREAGGAIAEGPPQNIGDWALEGVGAGATALLPGGAVAGQLTKAASPVIRGAAKTITSPFVRQPVRTTATDLAMGGAGGAGAYLGGEAAENLGADRQVGEALGGVLGATAPAGTYLGLRLGDKAASAVPGINSIYNWGKRNLAAFTPSGGRLRAHERLTGVSGRAGEDIAALEAGGEFNLTPAQLTGNPRLMALEKAARDADPELDERLTRRAEESLRMIEDGMRALSEGGAAQDTAEYFNATRRIIAGNLDLMLARAEAEAAAKVAGLAPGQKGMDASKAYRDALEGAYREARSKETELWQEVPEAVSIPVNESRGAYAKIAARYEGGPQADDIPAEARRFLGGDSNTSFGNDAPAQRLFQLYSRLRQTARNARGGENPSRNKARIADELADAILKDIDTSSDVSAPYRAAVTFSRELNQKFTRGTVGDVLGTKSRGGPAMAPEVTLERTIGRAGPQAAVSIDELRTAVGQSPDAEGAARDYLRGRFRRFAVTDGGVNENSAARFLRENDELLDRFPDLKRQIAETVESARFSREARAEVDAGIKAADESPVGRFADESKRRYGREFENILANPDAPGAARALAQAAKNDPSGAASRGLKDAAYRYLMKHGQEMPLRHMTRVMGDDRSGAAIRSILDNKELARVAQMMRAYESVLKSGDVRPVEGGVISDLPNTILDTIARVQAAKFGGARGGGTMGGSLQTAQIATSSVRGLLKRLTNDKAEQLLFDAIEDPDLMKSLLTSAGAPPGRKPSRQLAAWIGANTSLAIEDFFDENQPAAGPRRMRGPDAPPITTTGDNVDLSRVSPETNRTFTALQRRWGSALPASSAYRSPEENRAAGGAAKSRHMYGDALDVDLTGMPKRDRLRLINMASEVGFGGIGIYENSIHLDMSDRRAWGPSYKSSSVPSWASGVIKRHLAREGKK